MYGHGTSTTTTTPGPEATGPGGPPSIGLDAPPGWKWNPDVGWDSPMPGTYRRPGLIPAGKEAGSRRRRWHPGPRWKWIPAERFSSPNKKGETWWRPGYWEDRGWGAEDTMGKRES